LFVLFLFFRYENKNTLATTSLVFCFLFSVLKAEKKREQQKQTKKWQTHVLAKKRSAPESKEDDDVEPDSKRLRQ